MTKGQWPRGVTQRPRSGAAAENARLRRRRNGREEIPQVLPASAPDPGRGVPPLSWLSAPVATAVKRYPTPKVREIQVRW